MDENGYIVKGWRKCPICGFELVKPTAGHYEHMMRHVRRGEVEQHPDPKVYHMPWQFRAIQKVAQP